MSLWDSPTSVPIDKISFQMEVLAEAVQLQELCHLGAPAQNGQEEGERVGADRHAVTVPWFHFLMPSLLLTAQPHLDNAALLGSALINTCTFKDVVLMLSFVMMSNWAGWHVCSERYYVIHSESTTHWEHKCLKMTFLRVVQQIWRNEM